MGKRVAIVIGVAAAGVMALGAQTATSSTGGPVDSTCAPPTWSCPPDLQLVTAKEQYLNVGPGPSAVEVIASCGDVGIVWDGVHPASLPDLGCAVRAEGKLTKVRNNRLKPFHASIPGPQLVCVGQSCPFQTNFEYWESGGIASEDLKLRTKTREQVRKALDEGKNVKAKVIVHATYAGGNVATAKDTITLVACGPHTGQKCP